MTIANPSDLLGLQTHVSGTIVDHDEIIARAVHLGESQHDVDLSESPCSINIVVAANASPDRTSAAEDLQAGTPASTVQLLKTIGAIIGLALLATSATAAGLNSLILEQIAKMPSGGKYSVSHFAKIKLESTAHFESGKFFVAPTKPYVSFCSGATYIVFIKTIEALRDSGQLELDFATLNQLMIRDQHDGEGIWGRWNANGPGTARLFHELGLGRNFSDFAQAQPGDFMKIFWNQNVGKRESGHSVIFLGTTNHPDGEYVRFWSSNIGMGYGEKEVPRSKIAYAIFSRLETPANLTRIHDVPVVDGYLSSLLRKKSNFAEARQKCGI